MIFNNGTDPPDRFYASVIEINQPVLSDGGFAKPPVGAAYGPEKPLWEYIATPRRSFYSPVMSGAQRLPNGNTLICEATSTTLFEITPDGQTVWEYQPAAPELLPISEKYLGDTNLIFDCHRYAADSSALANKYLTPEMTIEQYAQVSTLTLESSTGGESAFPYGDIYHYGNGQVATIVARPDPDYRFAGWKVISGDIEIHNRNEAWTTFTMGVEDSVITSEFRKTSADQESSTVGWIGGIIAGIAVLGTIGYLWWKKTRPVNEG